MFIIDCAVQNSFSLLLLKKQKRNVKINDILRHRINSIEELSKKLIKPNSMERERIFSEINNSSIKKSVLNTIKSFNNMINNSTENETESENEININEKNEKRKRCKICEDSFTIKKDIKRINKIIR